MAFDCAVVGLGAMGAATLWRLAERGVRAVGVDRFSPPHDQGSTHGESRIIRTAYFEDPAYLPLVRRAFELWRELEPRSGEQLLTMTGAVMIGHADSAVVQGSLRTAREHALPHRLLRGADAAQRLPQHRLDPDDVVFEEEGGGVLRPEPAVAAMLRLAVELGATVMTDRSVRTVEQRAHAGVRLHLDDGETLEARSAVVCAGPWTGRLLPDFPVPLRVERQVNAWFAVERAQDFSPAAFPVFIRELPGGHFVYGLPGLDGATVKLAVHHEGPTVDPDDVPRHISDDDLRPLRDHAAERLHGVRPEPVRAITCLYTNTPDERFVVDTMPGMPDVVVVSACSGHGFKFAPAVGDAAARLALSGSAGTEMQPFRLRS